MFVSLFLVEIKGRGLWLKRHLKFEKKMCWGEGLKRPENLWLFADGKFVEVMFSFVEVMFSFGWRCI